MAPSTFRFSSSILLQKSIPIRSASRRKCPPCLASSDQGDLVRNVKKFMGDVQSRLPVIGLLSKLLSPEGGIGTEDLSYQEFCRAMFNNSSMDDPFTSAFFTLEAEKGVDQRFILFAIWMLKFGVGLVPSKDIVQAGTRLRVTKDLEIEIDRFEAIRELELKEDMYMERPKPSDKMFASTGVDVLSRLVCGKSEGAEVPQEDAKLIIDLLQAGFPSIPSDTWTRAFEARSERLSDYL